MSTVREVYGETTARGTSYAEPTANRGPIYALATTASVVVRWRPHCISGPTRRLDAARRGSVGSLVEGGGSAQLTMPHEMYNVAWYEFGA